MRKAFGLILAGLGAVTLTGAVAAASQDAHVLNVPLPDGSTARVEYVGNVAPRISVIPSTVSLGIPKLDLFDRSMFDVQRQIDAMMREMRNIGEPALVGPMTVAAYGDAPAGTSSVTIVTTSDGSKTCTRRTEVTSAGPGKPPKVASSATGDCAAVDTKGKKSSNPV